MTEPITLTLAELAARWNKTPPQALEYALHRLPLYFYFDGLVFDFSDKWHRANGDADAVQQRDAIKERLATVDIDLQRQTLHRSGQLKLSQWEDALSNEQLHALRAESGRLTAELTRLSTLLEQPSQQRQRSVRQSLLRAAPRTLQPLTTSDSAKFPHFAYVPLSPAGSTALDGKLVALEDGFPLKETLTLADICVSMHELEMLEAEEKVDFAGPAPGEPS